MYKHNPSRHNIIFSNNCMNKIIQIEPISLEATTKLIRAYLQKITTSQIKKIVIL